MDSVPDPIFPYKFLGYSRESNPGPIGWQSDVLITIPNIIIIIIIIITIIIIIIIIIRYLIIAGHEGPRGMWVQGSTYSQPLHWKR